MARHLCHAGRWSLVAPALGLLLFSLLPLLFTYAADQSNKPFDKAVLLLAAQEYTLVYKVLSVAGITLAISLLLFKRIDVPSRLLAGAAGCMLSFNFLLLPLIGAAQQEPVREAAHMAKSLGDPIVTYGINMPSFSVYMDQIVTRRAPQKGEIVLTRVAQKESLHTLDPNASFTLLFSKGGVELYRYD